MYRMLVNKKYVTCLSTDLKGACWFGYSKKHKFFKHKFIGITISSEVFLTTAILIGIHEAIHALMYMMFCFLNFNTMRTIQCWHEWIWNNTAWRLVNVL